MWLGNDDTVQGVGRTGTDGHLYQWREGVDGLGNPVGCWWRVSSQGPLPAYSRSTAPFLGEIAQGPDGQLYQWVQGVDGLGGSFGFWRRLARRVRRAAQRALPIARQLAPFVPGGAAALTAATPFLRQVGVEGADGLGALYQAPDGSMYQVQGLSAGDELDGLAAEEELNGLAADDELNGFAADEELNGLAAEEELNGLAADDELNGFAADEELNGLQAEEELNGLGAEDELSGLHADDELNGFAADDDLNGIGDGELQGVGDEDATMSGYVRQGGMSGVGGFQPERPPRTPAFSPSPSAPMWTPIW
jgi:hypothetical protein